MKAFLAALIALAAITVGANEVLKRAGFSSAEVNARESVRLSE